MYDHDSGEEEIFAEFPFSAPEIDAPTPAAQLIHQLNNELNELQYISQDVDNKREIKPPSDQGACGDAQLESAKTPHKQRTRSGENFTEYDQMQYVERLAVVEATLSLEKQHLDREQEKNARHLVRQQEQDVELEDARCRAARLEQEMAHIRHMMERQQSQLVRQEQHIVELTCKVPVSALGQGLTGSLAAKPTGQHGPKRHNDQGSVPPLPRLVSAKDASSPAAAFAPPGLELNQSLERVPSRRGCNQEPASTGHRNQEYAVDHCYQEPVDLAVGNVHNLSYRRNQEYAADHCNEKPVGTGQQTVTEGQSSVQIDESCRPRCYQEPAPADHRYQEPVGTNQQNPHLSCRRNQEYATDHRYQEPVGTGQQIGAETNRAPTAAKGQQPSAKSAGVAPYNTWGKMPFFNPSTKPANIDPEPEVMYQRSESVAAEPKLTQAEYQARLQLEQAFINLDALQADERAAMGEAASMEHTRSRLAAIDTRRVSLQREIRWLLDVCDKRMDPSPTPVPTPKKTDKLETGRPNTRQQMPPGSRQPPKLTAVRYVEDEEIFDGDSQDGMNDMERDEAEYSPPLPQRVVSDGLLRTGM